MECYDTCADRGKRCVLPRDRISCSDCGKIKPCYNIQSAGCGVCSPREPCSCGNKQEKEKWRSNDICKCKQSCWQWILSFFGFGRKLPECCRNVHLTAWESGEVAREALVSKVHDVVSLVSGKDQSAGQPRSSKAYEKTEAKESDRKGTSSGASSEKEGHPQETSEESPEQVSGKEQGHAAVEKKRKKSSKPRSSSLPRGRAKHRKTKTSKSRSTSKGDKQQTRKSSSKTLSHSSSSTSASQGDRKRKGSRSRSGSSTKIFNPFKGRQPVSQCNMRSPYCPPLPCTPCPGTQQKSFLSCLNEDQIAIFPEKCSSPSHQQSTRCPPTQQSQLRRSNSMSHRPFDACMKPAAETCHCCPDGSPKIPLRSHSFDSTPMRFASPRSCCLSVHTTCPRSGTWTCCSCSMKSNTNLKPYVRGSCFGRISSCGCQSVIRPAPSMCPPSCTKPCCLPVSSKLAMQGYTNTLETRQYTSPPTSFGTVSCSAALNILKARQNDALCNQLLSRYGYSPPSSRLCPLTCYGCSTANTCCSTSCLMYGRFPGMGGCIACRPMADHTKCSVCCVQCENYTNSRMPRSPECLAVKNQLIEFNESPCEKKPLCEFQLPPHCIRETGPRSPVDEYMAIIRVPKQARKQDQQEAAVVENTQEAEVALKKEQAEEAKTTRKRSKRLSRKSTARSSLARNVNENAKSECPNSDTSNRLQLYVARPGSPCSRPELVIPTEMSDCWLLHCEESFNNNYGGETYRISRYSSAGPVQIDFSELNARTNRYSNMPTHSSASSGFVARYSRPNYHTTSSNSDVRAITSFVSQMYNRDTRDLLDSRHFGESWYRPRILSNSSVNSHKLPENRPLTFNRSTNSAGLENSDMLNSSKYNVRLETAIENKIRELRDSKVFRSPPARRKMYSNSLFEQMTRAHEKPSLPVKRNLLQEEFIRESLDQLNHRAERRKTEFKFSETFINFRLPGDPHLPSEPAIQGDNLYQHRTDNSASKPATVSHIQNTTTRARETAPALQLSKTKIDYHHKRDTTPRIIKEMSDFSKENSQPEAPVCCETVNVDNIKPSSTLEYEPVFQSLFEQFQETVQVYVRSKKESDPSLDNAFKTKETQQNVFKVLAEDGKDKARNINAQAVEWDEENQSSNKVDKSLGNVRTLVAESSPPHKPIMVKSSDAENTSVCTCSCHSNSPGTSSVSLEIGRFPRFAQSCQSVSESVSCVDTSITFTKVTDVHRSVQDTPVNYSCNVVNQSLSASTVVSNTFTKTHQTEDSRTGSKTSRSQFKVSPENINALSTEKHSLASGGDSGSSVDPMITQCSSTLESILGNSSVDGNTEYYLPRDVRKAHTEVVNKPEAGDTTKCSSSTDVDLIPCQKPPVHVKSLTELMREFIRRNGTPV